MFFSIIIKSNAFFKVCIPGLLTKMPLLVAGGNGLPDDKYATQYDISDEAMLWWPWMERVDIGFFR